MGKLGIRSRSVTAFIVIFTLLLSTSMSVYGFSSELCFGKAEKVEDQPIIRKMVQEEPLQKGDLIYGSLSAAIRTGDEAGLLITIPPEFKAAGESYGFVKLGSNTEIIPNVYSTETLSRDWWEGVKKEDLHDKTIVYLIDVNGGEIDTKFSADCFDYLYDFQYVCGDYDAMKNPRGGLQVKPYSLINGVDFQLKIEGDKLLVTVREGEIRVHNDDIDVDVEAGDTREFTL